MKKSLRARAPLTDEDLAKLTADEFVRLKLTAEEKFRLKELSKTREKERIERSVRSRVEEEPMLTDLRAIGLSLESVWDLVNTSTKYRQAIPVLLKHLQLPYSDSTREGIARSLAVTEPEVRKAWPILVDQYRRSPTGRGTKAPGDAREYRLSANTVQIRNTGVGWCR